MIRNDLSEVEERKECLLREMVNPLAGQVPFHTLLKQINKTHHRGAVCRR